jgi:hypothetical protein
MSYYLKYDHSNSGSYCSGQEGISSNSVLTPDGDCEFIEHVYAAKLKILRKSGALGLQGDLVCGNEYCPNAITRDIASEPDSLRIAEQLMKNCRNVSKSWMCEHLGIPSSVAF